MSIKIKNRHRLKKRDIRDLQKQIEDNFNLKIELGDTVDSGIIEGSNVIFVDNDPCFTLKDKKIIITVQGLLKFKPRKNYVVVDMGAIEFVTNGADVMAPGIVDADKTIELDSQVWICDESQHKPLASGIALMNGEQMVTEKKGKAVKLIHFIGDYLWN